MDAGVGTIALSNGPSGASAVADYALDLVRAAGEGAALPDPPTAEALDLGERPGRYGPITVGETGVHAFGRDGDLRSSDEDDLYKTDHPDLCTFYVRFGRSDGGRVDHLMCGDAWYPSEGYAGPGEFPHPPEWAALPGLYRAHNPWLPAARITLCRGELAMEQSSYGRMPLEPAPGGGFALTTPEGRLPERLRFSTVVDGRSQRLETGGCVLYRAAGV
jgi:hypothetical protein